MNKLKQLIEECLNRNLVKIIISNPRNKDAVSKIAIRPIELRGIIWFQETSYVGTNVIHKNYDIARAAKSIEENLNNNFKQMTVEHTNFTANVLVSKKGTITIKKKAQIKSMVQVDLKHNKTKRYILEKGKKVDFLVDLGVMTKEGEIVKPKYDKFRQINRFLEFIEDIIPKLDRDRELTIIDFGCGKSYLTFAMYYYLHDMQGFNINVIGLDLKEDVIDNCNKLKDKYGFEKLNFFKGDIASFEGVNKVDMVVTLHACDTATDFALAKAVKWGAEVILSVPCCQHEVNSQIKNDILEPVLKYGLLKERMSALITDGLRAEALENVGYNVQVLEFIDMEHTPKNILIRAVKGKERAENREKYIECTELFEYRAYSMETFRGD